ncbi:hypothetical protein ACA350_00310 [Orientia tsutsugamushi]|uniref:hypothetical protein n=1 Tax=Orientia tsutsugamushi TaxID=784 RepID=UPI0035292B5B
MNATAYEKSVARNYADTGEVDKLSRLINSYPDLKSEIVPSSGLGLISHACSNISKRSVGSLLSSRTKKNNNTVKVIKLSTKNSNNSLDISDNAKEEDAITDAVSRHLFDHAKCMIQKSKLDKSLILKSIIKGAINLHPIIIGQQEEIHPLRSIIITNILDKVKNEQAHLQIHSMITEGDNCKIDKKFAVEDLGKLIFGKVIQLLIVCDDGGISHHKNLLQDYPSVEIKTTIFGKLAMDLFTISGGNFERYEKTVYQFPATSCNRINHNAMILESTKQTLLRVIKVSYLHKLIHNNPSEIHFQGDEELDNSIKLLEARLLYLINTCNKRSDKEENYTILLDFDDVSDIIHDIKFLTSTYTNNKEYSSSTIQAAKDCISNLAKQGIVKNLKTNFENDMAILACQINSILNNDINIMQIVPIISLVKQIDEKELVLIKFSDSEKELIKNNIKFDYSMNGYMSPKFNEVSNFQQLEKSLKYYEKTPEALSPILVLLKTAHDSRKISKLANNINTDYETIKSELCTLRNDYNEEKFEDEDNDVTKSMKSTIQSLNVKKTIVSNITYLASKINQALNISPIVSVFEEYNNNYQALDIQHDYEPLVLGDSVQTIA